jgi:phage baseplate assembly protein W
MAYIVRNVNVLDLKDSTGVGIGLPFNGPTGINTTYTTQEAIKANLLNFLLTGKRERIMNPGFGSGIQGVIFEQITDERIDEIENLIYGGIELYFPEVRINDVTINLSPESQSIQIHLNYTLINMSIEDELLINYGLGIGDTFNNNRII